MLSFKASASEPRLFFDTHLHYNQSHQTDWDVDQIIHLLDKQNVQYAAVTSTPPTLVLELKKQAPNRILPILSLYQKEQDKQHWYWDTRLVKHLETHLNRHSWSAIGEVHLFAQHRKSPVFAAILRLANQHQLPLLLHTESTVIDRVYDQYPKLTIIWAHTGVYPFPDLIRDYLQRYPTLIIDLSMRNERIAPEGELSEAWELLFFEHPTRFIVGVDTYNRQRWGVYDKVNKQTKS